MNTAVKPVNNNHAWLIFTDLDGSLLDHNNYSCAYAQDLLTTLEQHNIPVIFTSSKTFAEINALQTELANAHPFISENGNGVYVPVDYFSFQPDASHRQGDFWVHAASKPRDHWLSLLTEAKSYFKRQFICFSELSDNDIAAITGLSPQAARQASQRQFSEPVIWQGSAESKQVFINWLSERGATVLQGGRFLQVSDCNDKGSAMQWLANVYQCELASRSVSTLAVGDSHNDIAMLENADKAVVIHNPDTATIELQRTDNVFRTCHSASRGWVEGVTHFLPFLIERN